MKSLMLLLCMVFVTTAKACLEVTTESWIFDEERDLLFQNSNIAECQKELFEHEGFMGFSFQEESSECRVYKALFPSSDPPCKNCTTTSMKFTNVPLYCVEPDRYVDDFAFCVLLTNMCKEIKENEKMIANLEIEKEASNKKMEFMETELEASNKKMEFIETELEKLTNVIEKHYLNDYDQDLVREIKRQHPECTDYRILNDSRRSVHHGDGTYLGAQPAKCDDSGQSNTSPDWVGAGWYRMMGPAGSRIPETPPGRRQCGTHATGWMKGSHPAVVGRTIEEVTFCFDGTGYAGQTACQYSTQGKVTHCGDYYVYYLENTPTCAIRYCATHHF